MTCTQSVWQPLSSSSPTNVTVRVPQREADLQNYKASCTEQCYTRAACLHYSGYKQNVCT